MLRLVVLFWLFIGAIINVYSQTEAVSIETKTQGKRTLLYVQNHTDSIVNFFLRVNATGYRRSADKPLITNIDPGAKKLVMTLIAIDPTTATFDYDLIVNASLDNNMSLERDKFFVEDIGPYIAGDLVLFSTQDCVKCALLDSLLTTKKQAFRHFDIYQDQKLYNQFLLFLSETRGIKINDSIPLPIIWNRSDWLSSDMPAQVLAELLEKN